MPATCLTFNSRTASESLISFILHPPSMGLEVTDSLLFIPYLFKQEPVLTQVDTGKWKDYLFVECEIRSNITWTDGTPYSVDDILFTQKVQTLPLPLFGYKSSTYAPQTDKNKLSVYIEGKRLFSKFVVYESLHYQNTYGIKIIY